MQLDEIKKNISKLEQVLDKTNTDDLINVSVAETAQSKILKKFRIAMVNCAIPSIVFTCLWIGNISPEKLPNFYKAFISIMCGIAALWYLFLSMKLKRINIATITPAKLLSATTRIKILALSGEIIFGIAIVVFFTLLLIEMITLNQLVFYLIIVTLCLGIVISGVFFWPQYIRLFRDLNSVK